MAERYESFQGREPNIDVNLFTNAASAGINQGNAQKTSLQAKVSGFIGGVKDGLSIVSGAQTIASNAETIKQQRTQNEINSEPAVVQARKDQIVSDAAIAQAKAKEYEDGTAALTRKAEDTFKLAKAVQGYEDITNITAVNKALDDPATPPEKIKEILSQSYGTLSRDNAFAQQALARSQGRVDPVFLDTYTKGVDAVEIDKKRGQLAQANEKSIQQQALKQQEQIAEATATLQLSPRVKDVMENGLNGQAYDPAKLDVVRAGNVDVDPKTKLPKFDAAGKPIISASTNPDDKRYYATYDGEVIDTFDEDNGKEMSKSHTKSKLGTAAILGRTKLTPEEVKKQVSVLETDRAGLAANSSSIDRRIAAAYPTDMSKTPTISPSVLEGKSPAQQESLVARFNQQIQKLQSAPKEFRAIVARVNSNPLLAGQSPIIKAVASVESGGNPLAVSPTNVQGVMQVTSDTFDYVKRKYPTVMGKADKYSPEGSLLAGKLYMIDMLNLTGDMELSLAAYNAGPAPIMAAKRDAGRNATWATIKPFVAKYVSAAKYKEVESYPERVLKFYSFYNG